MWKQKISPKGVNVWVDAFQAKAGNACLREERVFPEASAECAMSRGVEEDCSHLFSSTYLLG